MVHLDANPARLTPDLEPQEGHDRPEPSAGGHASGVSEKYNLDEPVLVRPLVRELVPAPIRLDVKEGDPPASLWHLKLLEALLPSARRSCRAVVVRVLHQHLNLPVEYGWKLRRREPAQSPDRYPLLYVLDFVPNGGLEALGVLLPLLVEAEGDPRVEAYAEVVAEDSVEAVVG